MKYLILGYIQNEMIVSVRHVSGTADMNMKLLIYGDIYIHLEMIVSRIWR